ncbi:hypothetical protein GCM10027406_07420 [Leifsonia lichenia]
MLTLAAIVGVAAVVAVAGSALLGVQPVVVISGSMEPTLPVGSMVFAQEIPASTVRVGDIVTTQRQDGAKGLITHRVVSVKTTGTTTTLRLRGDANASEDPLPYVASSVGKYLFHVPWAGTLALAARTPFGLTAIGVYVIALVALVIVGRPRPAARPADAAAARAAGRAEEREAVES